MDMQFHFLLQPAFKNTTFVGENWTEQDIVYHCPNVTPMEWLGRWKHEIHF